MKEWAAPVKEPPVVSFLHFSFCSSQRIFNSLNTVIQITSDFAFPKPDYFPALLRKKTVDL